MNSTARRWAAIVPSKSPWAGSAAAKCAAADDDLPSSATAAAAGGDGLVRRLHRKIEIGQAQVSVEHCRVQARRLMETGERFCTAAVALEQAQIVMGFGQLGGQQQGLRILGGRQIRLTAGLVDATQLVVGLSQIGIQADGHLKTGDRSQ